MLKVSSLITLALKVFAKIPRKYQRLVHILIVLVVLAIALIVLNASRFGFTVTTPWQAKIFGALAIIAGVIGRANSGDPIITAEEDALTELERSSKVRGEDAVIPPAVTSTVTNVTNVAGKIAEEVAAADPALAPEAKIVEEAAAGWSGIAPPPGPEPSTAPAPPSA